VWILWRRVLPGRNVKGNEGHAGRLPMSSAFSVLSGYSMSSMRDLVENLESSNVRGEAILHERGTRVVQTAEWITTVAVALSFPPPQLSNNSAPIDFYMHVPLRL
jgi:hypothetical protein